ncbi:multicopper oxidase-domain-containing protein [Podospora fimiseda]|uniref:Multicopper oxidase-domain-containing protein n=1 Tax=Podospora fimiseda TaxID=252190 RepID=A0AAN7BI31_9PEZI|nr:multicopper oxidase-domain-containing protein [Podospora fimiseda]
MTLSGRLWTVVTQILSIASLNPFNTYNDKSQVPIFSPSKTPSTDIGKQDDEGPRFPPPGHAIEGPGSDFQCDYSKMAGWRFCSTPQDRGCWLTDDNGNFFNLTTNYEDFAPEGILREYLLEITDKAINADGLIMPEGKIFNNTYPGPWIEACWGDTVRITVVNKMKHNGTSIHWHGVRQNRTMHMDGVNGITQCPIAPGDSFVYEWKATQYGSSWYHSHYSIQYADGLVGPLTLHGPSSGNFEEAADIPLLMTDWAHNSGFEAVYPRGPGMKDETILLNGIGNITRQTGKSPTEEVPAPYTLHFEEIPADQPDSKPKRYLLRLINTSFLTTFVFSIDHHQLTVISSDFVPVKPYTNTSVLIGIGQRYNIIVEANPIAYLNHDPPADGNFWIRTEAANCTRPPPGAPPRLPGYETNGILRYNKSSTDLPTSKPWDRSLISLRCSDETYTSLEPILKWQVGTPANGGEEHRVKVDTNISGKPEYGPLAAWGLLPNTFGATFTPLRIDFNNPTMLHLNNTSGQWPEKWIITPENYGDDDWVYMAIAGDTGRTGVPNAGAHPIHLHGHDFALLQQAENTFLTHGNLSLKFDNPPRRDVVLLPQNGFVVIAFKTDNPGSWLLHCHIATHAAEGLAMQILERREDADKMWPFETSPVIEGVKRTCDRWNEWHGDCKNWWPGEEDGCKRNQSDPIYSFQDDSGI